MTNESNEIIQQLYLQIINQTSAVTLLDRLAFAS